MEMKIPKVIVNSPSIPNKVKYYRLWIITILVNITSISYGFHIGWITSVANVFLYHSPLGYPLHEPDILWLANCPNVAALLSIPVWMVLVDKFGRKPCLLYCCWIQVVGWLFIISARNITTLMIGRVTGGVAGGGVFYIMPIYVKEICQDDLRGTLGLMSSLFRNIGVLAVYAMGTCLNHYTILAIALFVSTAAAFIVNKIPESPSYYAKIGKNDVAAITIAQIRNLDINDVIVQDALMSIQSEDEKFKSIPNLTCVSIFNQKVWRKGFAFMTMLLLFGGLNGGLSIINFAPIILNVSQITLDPHLQTLSIPAFMIIGVLISMVFVERLGRKVLLLVTGPGGIYLITLLLLATSFLLSMISFSAVAALVFLKVKEAEFPAWLAVIVILVPACCYAAAISPIPFIMAAEMFNLHIRAQVMGCLTMVSWGSAFIQLLVFAPISNACGPHITFICFAIINLFGIAVVLVLLPETTQKSVAEIESEIVN